MKRVVLSFWLLNCLSIFVLWAVTLATGHGWRDGLLAYQNGGWAIHNQPALAIPMGLSLLGLPLLFAQACR